MKIIYLAFYIHNKKKYVKNTFAISLLYITKSVYICIVLQIIIIC